jgi:hypothetical protein
LFVYWIHVELVYGYAAWPIRHRLELWEAAAAYAIFCALMYDAVLLRDRIVDRWRADRATGPSARRSVPDTMRVPGRQDSAGAPQAVEAFD